MSCRQLPFHVPEPPEPYRRPSWLPPAAEGPEPVNVSLESREHYLNMRSGQAVRSIANGNAPWAGAYANLAAHEARLMFPSLRGDDEE